MNLDTAYLKCADTISELSYARKKKVGAIIVKDNHIISEGYNGTPVGYDNVCEDDTGYDPLGPYWKTRKEVLHAESNAIAKLAKSHNSSEGATIYCTYSPCFDCAKLIVQAGIKKVVFIEKNDHDDYLDTINFLANCHITVQFMLQKIR